LGLGNQVLVYPVEVNILGGVGTFQFLGIAGFNLGKRGLSLEGYTPFLGAGKLYTREIYGNITNRGFCRWSHIKNLLGCGEKTYSRFIN